MGGFHGGAGGGGGGGFHGGSSHSSGGFHGGSSGSPIHTVVNGRHYINGHRFYGAFYGFSGNRPMKFIEAIGLSAIVTLAGTGLLLATIRPSVDATVTKTSIVSNGTNVYEVYDFTYTYAGKTYSGHGDDNVRAIPGGGYDTTVNEGEVYPVYISLFNHSDYLFDAPDGFAIGLESVVVAAGVGMAAWFVFIYVKHRKVLKEIGDVNGDGKIDDADLEYADAVNSGKAEGAHAAEAENTYTMKRKIAFCCYCGAKLGGEERFCPSCGASVAFAEHKSPEEMGK